MSFNFPEMNHNSSLDNETTNNGINQRPIAIYAGPCVAIFFPLIGFIAFVINRSLRIKRQHIISINICLSIIIYNIGFLVSMLSSEEDVEVVYRPSTLTSGCIAGSIIVMFGWFSVHFWIFANWIYMAFIIQLRVSRHISQFLIKSTLPTYGCAALFLAMVLIMTVTQSDELQSYNQFLCWFNLGNGSTTEWVFGLASAISGVGIMICALTCCFELACKTSKSPSVSTMKKNKRFLARLSVLTLIVLITSVAHLSWWIMFNRAMESNAPEEIAIDNLHQKQNDFAWLEIFFWVFTGIEGIAATLYLIVPADDFQSLLGYCTAMIKCQDPTAAQNRSLGSTMRSSKQLENNNVMDVRDSVASDERPVKFVPREEISRDFANSSKELDLYTATFPMEKNRAKARASTTRPEKNGQSAAGKQKENSSAPGTKTNSKKKGIRASFRLPTKSSSSSTSGSTPKSPDPTCSSPVNKYHFNRESKISMTREHERKTSF